MKEHNHEYNCSAIPEHFARQKNKIDFEHSDEIQEEP